MQSFSCPVPLRRYPQIVMGHGSGGQMTQELIEHLFAPAFGMNTGTPLLDGAVLDMAGLDMAGQPGGNGRLVFTTDSFVVSPLFFPGGDIGSLAVHGTVNDLAMMGARPVCLSAGFILEEGLPMQTLGRAVESMAQAARRAGVRVITGDTKVVERGHGDGLYINTSGVGTLPAARVLSPRQVTAGDRLVVSGNLGDHGIAIMSQRAGLHFETAIVSDSAPLHDLAETMLAAAPSIRVMRDLTRGGLSAALNEIARDAQVGLVVDEANVPVQPAVAAACDMLGLDPFYVANEGKLLAIVPQADADALLAAMHIHPLGQEAVIIGTAIADHTGVVVGRTAIGGQRVIDLPAGEVLPRIC